MAEERGVIIGDRVETRLDGLAEDVAELKGAFGQMDKRLSNVETAIGGLRQEVSAVRQEIGKEGRQIMWTVLGTWIATMLTILFKH